MRKRKRNQWGFSPGPLIRVICCNPVKAGTVVVYFALFSTWNRVNHHPPVEISAGYLRTRVYPTGYSASARVPLAYKRINAVIQPALQCNSLTPRSTGRVFAPSPGLEPRFSEYYSRPCPVRGRDAEKRASLWRNSRGADVTRVVTRFVFRYYQDTKGFLSRWRAILAVSMQLWFLLWENGMNPIQRRIVRLSEDGFVKRLVDWFERLSRF